jgi:hypothetical protein
MGKNGAFWGNNFVDNSSWFTDYQQKTSLATFSKENVLS